MMQIDTKLLYKLIEPAWEWAGLNAPVITNDSVSKYKEGNNH